MWPSKFNIFRAYFLAYKADRLHLGEKQGDDEKVFYLSDFDPNKVLSLVSFSK